MFSDDQLLPISALQHVLYCERQAALIHVEGLWAENVFTAQGRLLHQKADAGRSSRRRQRQTRRSVPLVSHTLGLFGVADVIEFVENPLDPARPTPLIVEYKRGKRKPHDADRVQLCAQAMCLEEMLATTVPRGHIFHGLSRDREEVEFTPDLRDQTRAAVTRLRELVDARHTPPARYQKKLCNACSLRRLCMPEILQGLEPGSLYLRRSIQLVLASPQGPTQDDEP